MAQEHERGLGNWQAELAEMAGALPRDARRAEGARRRRAGLEVDAARMRDNIERLHGLVVRRGRGDALLAPRSARRARTRWLETLVAARRARRPRICARCARARWPATPTPAGIDAAPDAALFDAGACGRSRARRARPPRSSTAARSAVRVRQSDR